MPVGGILKQPRRLGRESSALSNLDALGLLIPSAGIAAAGNRAVSGDRSDLLVGGALAAATANPVTSKLKGITSAANKARKSRKASRFRREVEVHPDGRRLVNVDVKSGHAKLLSELGHDFALDTTGNRIDNPIQLMGKEAGRVRIRIPEDRIDEFAEYVDEFIGDPNRGSKLPPGIGQALKALLKE